MNFEMNYHKMVSADQWMSHSQEEFKKNMSQSLLENDTNSRILAFKNKAPTPREGITQLVAQLIHI